LHQRPIKTSEDFIQTWHIPEGICDGFLEYFENNEKLHVEGCCIEEGKGGVVVKDAKESTDIPISPSNMNQPFMDYRIELQKCLNQYIKIYPHIDNMNKFDITENYNIQHYPKGGGFKKEHFERDGTFSKSIKRCLVFMTYLNDLDDGGTKFIYQNRIVKAQKCKTVIFPVDWTHTHVSQISNTKEKTIVTGWYSYLWDS
tara:strand:- start:444 stop:1043 length:600 start_codon:yes stop_codon:yes gene_type:complete